MFSSKTQMQFCGQHNVYGPIAIPTAIPLLLMFVYGQRLSLVANLLAAWRYWANILSVCQYYVICSPRHDCAELYSNSMKAL